MQKFLGKSKKDFISQMIEICKEMTRQEDLKYTDSNDEMDIIKKKLKEMA